MNRVRRPGRDRVRHRPNRFVRALLLLAVCVGLGACGVPLDSVAHRVTLGQALEPGAAPTSVGGTPTDVMLYFVRHNRLVAVKRPGLAYSSIETVADELLVDLGNGPLKSEQPNLVTLLNSNPGLTCTYNQQTHIITVKLDLQFIDTLFGPPLYEAYGQIVLTLMQTPLLSAVQAVNFTSNGALAYAYLPTETATASPVTSASYESLVESSTK